MKQGLRPTIAPRRVNERAAAKRCVSESYQCLPACAHEHLNRLRTVSSQAHSPKARNMAARHRACLTSERDPFATFTRRQRPMSALFYRHYLFARSQIVPRGRQRISLVYQPAPCTDITLFVIIVSEQPSSSMTFVDVKVMLAIVHTEYLGGLRSRKNTAHWFAVLAPLLAPPARSRSI